MTFPYKKFSDIKNLGPAGTDEVYSATIGSARHRVVIKKLATDLSEYHTSYKMFDLNVKTLKSLHHTNIIRVFDYGVYENSYYMSMEYIDGFDLECLLHLPMFNRSIALMVVFHALTGLMHAHKHGVFHCDIKPGNILVGRNGKTKLSDFGLAHVKEHLLHAGTSGSVFTTPFYMPPEQAAAIADGALDSDVWAETTTLAYKETPEQHAKTVKDQTLYWDMWSVGVLLYRICTGRLPFQGKNLAQLANSIATLEPANLHSLAPSIPSDLCNAIESCMIKDPQKRLASLDPVIASLQLYILSTGVHDIEGVISKHLLDCTMHQATAVEPDLQEISTDSPPGKASFSLSSLPLFLLKHGKIAGIGISVLVFLLLGTMFFLPGSKKTSAKGGPASQHESSAKPPVNLPGNAAAVPAPAATPSAPSSEAELLKLDSAMSRMSIPESSSKPIRQEKQKTKAPQKKPPAVTLKKASVALPNKNDNDIKDASENQTGGLRATVDPPTAVISIDGVPIPGMELSIGMQFPTGSHTISITADGYSPYQMVLQIEPNTTQVLSIALKQQERGNGFLQVSSVPWSNIYIDGMMFGTTPTLTPLSLKDGDHVLILQRDGFLPVTQTVRIKNEAMTRVQIDLVKEDSTSQE